MCTPVQVFPILGKASAWTCPVPHTGTLITGAWVVLQYTNDESVASCLSATSTWSSSIRYCSGHRRSAGEIITAALKVTNGLKSEISGLYTLGSFLVSVVVLGGRRDLEQTLAALLVGAFVTDPRVAVEEAKSPKSGGAGTILVLCCLGQSGPVRLNLVCVGSFLHLSSTRCTRRDI